MGSISKAGLRPFNETQTRARTSTPSMFLFVAQRSAKWWANCRINSGRPAQLEIVLEEVASRVLKRELQIGELLEVEVGWDTYLLARDVSMANPDWAEERDFARAGRLLIRINLPSIWRDGPILVSELELSEATVTLLAPEDQAPNWDFWPGDDE